MSPSSPAPRAGSARRSPAGAAPAAARPCFGRRPGGGVEAAAPSHVVNVVSVAGTVAFPPGGPYAASKHAQLAFSRATAAQLARRGILVHTVLPGFVETEGFPQRTTLPAAAARLVIDPEDVTRRILD